MSRRQILSFCICFLLLSVARGQGARSYYVEATKALENKNYEQYYASIRKAYELHPYNQNILWHMGVASALNHKPDAAIDFLSRAVNISTGFDLDDPNLVSLKNLPRFQQLIKAKEELARPLIHSDTAYVLDDRQLHLESVTFDPVDKSIFGGSVHKRKIIKVDKNKNVKDFTLPEQHGLGAVFGVRVNAKERILWACSSPIPEMQDYDSTLASALFEFDLKTGRLLNKYIPSDTLKDHLFGDLTLDSKGVPFVSDTKNNIIYKFDGSQNRLVPYFTSKEFWGIQGIAFSDDDKFLYISDYVKGIFVLDVSQHKLTQVNSIYTLSLKGTDGLLFFRNSIITIQNGVQPYRVIRHYLNDAGTAFTRYEFIDNAHPAFGEPTIGSVSGDRLYYVANSQWSAYSNGQVKKAEELHPIVILGYSLK